MKRTCAMICLSVVVVTAALAQPSGSSSPKPPADTKTLAATLKLIQDKVNAQGEIRYTMISENTVQGGTVEDQYAVETSHAVADPRSCNLQVDAKMSMNGKTRSQGRMGAQFREITGLSVRTQSQLIAEKTAKAGVTGWKGKITPETYVVQAFHDGNLLGMLFFRDRETADLVANAMSGAVKSCGGEKIVF